MLSNAELLPNDAVQFAQLGLAQAFGPPENAAAVVEEDERGIVLNAEFGPHGTFVIDAPAEQEPVVNPLALADAAHLANMIAHVALLFRNADDFQAVVVIDVVYRVEVPNRLAAGHAPRSPEVNQHQPAAAILAVFPLLAVQVFQGEVFQRVAGELAGRDTTG